MASSSIFVVLQGLYFLMLVIIVGTSMEHNEDEHGSGRGHINRPFADESFRRLQSGENSDELVNQCCRREPKYITVGYGIDTSQLRVDVGECRQICEKSPIKPLKRDEFDKYLKNYPNMDPVQIFLALQSRILPQESTNTSLSHSLVNSIEDDLEVDEGDENLETDKLSLSLSSSSCLSSSCQPVSTRTELHFGLRGQKYELQVIESCDCIRIPRTCQRIPRTLTLHYDTPHETEVDLGQCMGPCGDDDMACRPIRNKTISVQGPNGAQCYQAIEECECTGDCYRTKEFFKVYDYVHSFQKSENMTIGGRSGADLHQNSATGISATTTLTSTSTNIGEPLTKVIDIGRCGGSNCGGGQHHGGQITSKCLFRSENGTCLSSLYGGESLCAPNKFMTHSYVDKKGLKHDLLSIISCACH